MSNYIDRLEYMVIQARDEATASRIRAQSALVLAQRQHDEAVQAEEERT